MNGTIVRRSAKSFSFVLDLGRVGGRRRQKWLSFKPTAKHTVSCTLKACSDRCKARAEAEEKLASILERARTGTFVEPTKLTLGTWIETWFARTIEPSCRRSTVRTYRTIVRKLGSSWLGSVPIQHVTPSQLEQYYGELGAEGYSAATIASYHAIVRSSLAVAVRDRMVVTNVARERVRRPPLTPSAKHAKAQHWTAEEASRFLEAADGAGPQLSAFFALALDIGARKAELIGLTWDRVDLEAGVVTVDRQLIGTDDAGGPEFGPTKTSDIRSVALSPPTVTRLRTHRREQAETKMKNRTAYADHNLVFAKEDADLTTPGDRLGQPMRINRLGNRVYHRLREAAGVRRIVFHGLRHSVASLMLEGAVPVRDVADRLGHSNASMTLNTYAHSMPHRQHEHAARLGSVLFKRG